MKTFTHLTLTHPLYVSPSRKRNEQTYGQLSANQCICCLKPMKEGETKTVHMNEHWFAVNKEITETNCKELTGANSQGYFPIGNSCAKKMPKEFIHS